MLPNMVWFGATRIAGRVGVEMAEGSKQSSVNDRTNASIEETVKSVWRELLQLDDMSVTDDFFRLGGNSLTAVMMLKLLQDEHGLSLPLKSLYLNPTIQGIVSVAMVEGEI